MDMATIAASNWNEPRASCYNPVMSKYPYFSILAVILLILAKPAFGQKQLTVKLTKGEQRAFRIPGVSKISISGDGKVADVKKIGKDQFVLFAVDKGRASLLVILRNGRRKKWRIIVKGDEVERFRQTCEELFGADSCKGLLVTEAGDKLVISGQVNDLETYHKLRKMKNAFPDIVLMLEVPPRILDALVTVINEELAKAGLEDARVTRVADRLILEGTVMDEREKKKAQAIVEALYESVGGSGSGEDGD